MNSVDQMTAAELKNSLALALIFFLRMLGLFLVLPVFVLYARELPDATPTLIGVALSTYGLTQALFQIPFGWLSDRIGRKPVITAGLLVFVLGSLIAGSSGSIFIIILGRALQGAGAIAAAVMALTADLTRETQRSKAMALIGISVGIAFMLAFVLGPALNPHIGVPGLFYLSAALAIFAILILFTLVTIPAEEITSGSRPPASHLAAVMADRKLQPLYFSIFLLHFLLISSFVVIPLLLRDQAGMETARHWQIYLPVLAVSGLLLMPLLILGEKYGRIGLLFAGAVVLMLLTQCGFYFWHDSLGHVGILLFGFFLAFNYLEAILPALITRLAPATDKGAALGIYSTSQFAGTFCGGLSGGYLYGQFGLEGVFMSGAVVSLIWLMTVFLMQNPLGHNKL